MAEQTTALLEVRNLRVAYAGVPALHGVSLEVYPGEIVAVVGSNGAGKSTLLRAVSGLVRATAGSVRSAGNELLGLPPHRITAMGIVQVPEGRWLFGRMTVEENLLLASGLLPKNEQHGAIERELVRFPELARRRHQRAGNLSGGEQAMLAVARALLTRPKILLLDEPSLGLAPRIVAQLHDLIRQIRDEGVSVLLVEQRTRETLKIAGRAYVLQTGRIVASGPAAELAQSDLIRKAYLGL